jgi:hypothetical protein
MKTKHSIGLNIEKNSFVDDGQGVITFPNKLTITDDSVQKNGTRYDIESMDLSEYRGQITADHVDMIQAVIGEAINTAKQGARVVIDGIRFAINANPLALVAYNLMREGFVKDVSIETYGDAADSDGVYRNAKLVGLSTVVVGNNSSATINNLVRNSIKQAKENGLDVDALEEVYSKPKRKDNNMSKELKTEDKVENQAEVKTEEVKTEAVSAEAIANALKEAVAPIAEKVEALEKNAFDKSAEVPQFVKSKEKSVQTAENKFKSMDWEDRTVAQIENARQYLVRGDIDAARTLNEINKTNFELLKKEGLVKNAMTISDFGNFVISPEQLSEIQGCRNNYADFVNNFGWRETLSTQMQWLDRSSDISMTEVEFCDDDADGNLKPVSEYGASIKTSTLSEVAAVTPVCNALTRFLAADVLADVSAGYRNAYDKSRAQLIVARLEQAVEANGNSVIYDVNPAVEASVSVLSTWNEIANCTPGGTFIMSTASYSELVAQLVRAGIAGPLANLVTTGNQQSLFGRNYILVPNDLLPTLNSAETRAFVVNGVTVTINHAVFYVDTNNFTGRISGGLQYDLSTDAAYEVGDTVKSAFQRNELLLRGSFFRGGAVLDQDQVSGLLSPGVS